MESSLAGPGAAARTGDGHAESILPARGSNGSPDAASLLAGSLQSRSPRRPDRPRRGDGPGKDDRLRILHL